MTNMDNSIEIFEKIEDYLNNRLNEQEKAEFEAQINSDDELALSVNLQRKIIAASGEKQVIELRKTMRLLADEILDSRSKSDESVLEDSRIDTVASPLKISFINPRWLAVAAAIVILGVAYYFMQPSIQSSPQELFAANYNSPSSISLIEQGGADNDNFKVYWAQAELFYQTKNYNKALLYMDSIIAIRTDNVQDLNEALRTKSILYLNIQDGKSAEKALSQIGNNSGFENDKAWYMALALLLQSDKKIDARIAFEKIAAHPNTQSDERQKKAKEIAKQLMADH